MNREQWLLVSLSEECNELSKRVCKALRFGINEIQQGQNLNNRERIVSEFLDVLAVVSMLNVTDDLRKHDLYFDLDSSDITDRVLQREKWIKYAKSRGEINE